MKQGEILKEYADSKGLSVAQLGRDLEKDRSGIYALFRSKTFTQGVYNNITRVYPDFAEYKPASQQFAETKQAYNEQGLNPKPPPALDSGQLAHMILSNSSVSLASYELLCRAVAILEKREVSEVVEESNQVVHDKMTTFEKLLKEMISLP